MPRAPTVPLQKSRYGLISDAGPTKLLCAIMTKLSISRNVGILSRALGCAAAFCGPMATPSL